MTHRRASVMFACLASIPAAQAYAAEIRYDESTRVFELSAQQVTYAFGVNERGELQSLYWGGRLASVDILPAAKSDAGLSSFDTSTGTTPQEYPAWGSAFYTEPALKVSFPDGNRDLVLHYLSQDRKSVV